MLSKMFLPVLKWSTHCDVYRTNGGKKPGRLFGEIRKLGEGRFYLGAVHVRLTRHTTHVKYQCNSNDLSVVMSALERYIKEKESKKWRS